MAEGSTSRRWQAFLVSGLIACVASFYLLLGSGKFAALSGLVTLSIALFNAFLSPATTKAGENWFVGAIKRALVVGKYAKVVCIALWTVAIVNLVVFSKVAYGKSVKVDIDGLIIDKLRGAPVEKGFVNLQLGDGTNISSDAPNGRFEFTGVDRRKAAKGESDLEANCDGVRGRLAVDLSKGSIKAARIPISLPITVTGRVIDADERPIEDAKVILQTEAHKDLNTVFAQNGVFTFGNVMPHRVFVRAERGEITSEVDVDLEKNWRDPVILRLNLHRPPPTKRTFFVLKGHAIDILVRDKKLPTELESKLGGNLTLIETPAFRELCNLMERFSVQPYKEDYLSYSLSSEADDFKEKKDVESRRRAAALKKIERTQLKKLASTRVLDAAGRGTIGILELSDLELSKLPAAFFSDGPWFVDGDKLYDWLRKNKNTKRVNPTRLEVPLQATGLSKFATRADVDVLRTQLRFEGRPYADDPLFRFYDYISRNGMPPNFLLLDASAWQNEVSCGASSGAQLNLEAPALQLRVVVLENITDSPVELGNFHFRVASTAGAGPLRTSQENVAALTASNPEAEPWFQPRMLKPSEKVAVPLELILGFDEPSADSNSNGREEKRSEKERQRRRRECAEILRGDKDIQTIDLVYPVEKPEGVKQPLLVRVSKQKFIDALLRKRPSVSKTDEFVYGTSIALEAVDVNGFRYAVERFNPKYVSYFSGFQGGSCPFVYCQRKADGAWVKQGAIIKGRKSKALEGPDELAIRGFDGILRISEEEAEISYIDELFVRAKSNKGDVTLSPLDERLARKDGYYVVLKRGESIDIRFAVPNVRLDRVRVIASGFFQPTQPARGQ
jgi:hypothetical protein